MRDQTWHLFLTSWLSLLLLGACGNPGAVCEEPAPVSCPAGTVPFVDWGNMFEGSGSPRDVCRGNTESGPCTGHYAQVFRCYLDNASCLDEGGVRQSENDPIVMCSALYDQWGACIAEVYAN